MASEIYAGVLAVSVLLPYGLGMADELSTKIRRHRQSLGMNQTEYGELFGVTQATVSRWEKGSIPDSPQLAQIADKMGASVKDLIGADFTVVPNSGPRLYVKGAVAAGVWREALQWEQEEWIPYSGGNHIQAPEEHRFGLVVEGESMNQIYPPGTILDCVSALGSGEQPRSGQRVVVIRKRFSGEMEATVKEYVRDGDKEWLVPRSNNPAFQRPIELGTSDDGIEETSIIAVVRGAYLPE